MHHTTLRQPPVGIKRRTLIMAAPALLLAQTTRAAAPPKIEVIRPWVRFSRDLETSAYFTLLNHTEETDRLTAVVSPLAERCAIQKVTWKGLTMSLVDQASVDVPAKSRLEFNPKSLRVTITFAKTMDRSDPVPLTLTFAKAGRMEINAAPTERLLGPPRRP